MAETSHSTRHVEVPEVAASRIALYAEKQGMTNKQAYEEIITEMLDEHGRRTDVEDMVERFDGISHGTKS